MRLRRALAIGLALASLFAAEGLTQVPEKICVPVVSSATGVAITSCQDVTSSNPFPSAAALPGIDALVTKSLTAPGVAAINTGGATSVTFTLTGSGAGMTGTFQGLVAGSATQVNVPSFTLGASASPTINAPNANVAANGTYVVPATGFQQISLNLTAISSGSLGVFGEAGSGGPSFAFAYAVGANGLAANAAIPADSFTGVAALDVFGLNAVFNGATWDRWRALGSGTGIAAVDLAPSANAAIGITPVASGSAVASQVLKATPGNFYSGTAVNTTTTAGFCLVINATSAPTTGSAVTPLEFAVLPASGSCSIVRSPPDVFSTGIVFLVSNNASPFIFTSGTITAAISGQIQ